MLVMLLIKFIINSLSDDNNKLQLKKNFFIKVSIDKENRTIKISDTGIGMNKEELDNNLGVIAKVVLFNSKRKMKLKMAMI